MCRCARSGRWLGVCPEPCERDKASSADCVRVASTERRISRLQTVTLSGVLVLDIAAVAVRARRALGVRLRTSPRIRLQGPA